jgi:undecaprenyl pyrophosphate phosphatase UppP
MNKYAIWFRWVVWFGVIGNWAFSIAVFVDANNVLAFLQLGSVESTIWLFNYSVLLALLSCFYIPAAHNPFRYRVNCWLLVACRLIPATTFFVGVALSYMPREFLRLGFGDGTVGMIELVLLILLLRGGEKKTE